MRTRYLVLMDGLFTTTMLNTKATDSENVIPDFTTLPTKTALIRKEAEV